MDFYSFNFSILAYIVRSSSFLYLQIYSVKNKNKDTKSIPVRSNSHMKHFSSHLCKKCIYINVCAMFFGDFKIDLKGVSKKLPNLVSHFLSTPRLLSSKLSTLWPSSVYAVDENVFIFQCRAKYK